MTFIVYPLVSIFLIKIKKLLIKKEMLENLLSAPVMCGINLKVYIVMLGDFIFHESEGPSKTSQICRFACAFKCCWCNKYHLRHVLTLYLPTGTSFVIC